jgi:hypothetical protein
MNDWFYTAVLIVGSALAGAGVALAVWPPVELEFIDGEMTKVMVCKMTTSRHGVIQASCADLQALIDSVRGGHKEDSSL